MGKNSQILQQQTDAQYLCLFCVVCEMATIFYCSLECKACTGENASLSLPPQLLQHVLQIPICKDLQENFLCFHCILFMVYSILQLMSTKLPEIFPISLLFQCHFFSDTSCFQLSKCYLIWCIKPVKWKLKDETLSWSQDSIGHQITCGPAESSKITACGSFLVLVRCRQ